MRAYKIDLSMYEGKVRELISEAVQKKAFELGCGWGTSGKKVIHADKPFLFIHGVDGIIGWDNSSEYYKQNKNTAMAAADFLALTTAKGAPAFKPFDRVLVRDYDDEVWICSLFSHVDESSGVFVSIGLWWKQCIPYKGNEHLVGTTDDPK